MINDHFLSIAKLLLWVLNKCTLLKSVLRQIARELAISMYKIVDVKVMRHKAYPNFYVFKLKKDGVNLTYCFRKVSSVSINYN